MEQTSLPPHVEEAVQAIARLHAEHHREASSVERFIDNMTAAVGSPAFLGLFPGFVVAWIAANTLGLASFDPPPFGWLVGLLGLIAVLMGALILTSQRRADRLAARRDQLNLELTILADQKTAKIVALLEELRFDSPNVRDRADRVAQAMSSPAEPKTVLEAFEAPIRR